MTPEDIRILSDVSKYDEKTREALAVALEIAHAAAKRGVLPNEAVIAKPHCFTDEELIREGFTPWRYDSNKWQRGEVVLSFKFDGVARLTKWKGRQIVAAADAETLDQLRNLI